MFISPFSLISLFLLRFPENKVRTLLCFFTDLVFSLNQHYYPHIGLKVLESITVNSDKCLAGNHLLKFWEILESFVKLIS